VKTKHQEELTKGEFYFDFEGKRLASMTYSKAGKDKIIIDHTFVDPTLKGQGVGYKLIESVVDFAKSKDLKIIPLCPFASSVFQKRPEYKELLN